MDPHQALVLVKIAHTLAWAFFVSCILAVPPTALAGRLGWSATLSCVVLFECLVLAMNHFRCPLTDLAARYTSERTDAFDIYLPAWLARHNKEIFGSLFVASELVLLWCWRRRDA